jgi:hypothetical protein
VRRSALSVLAVLLLVLGVPAARADLNPGEGIPLTPLVELDQLPAGPGITSDNLTYLGTIPIDAPGVGARLVTVDGQRRFYVSGIPGLSIYDVTDPEAPALLGHLPLPNWENEDVSVSADGDWTLVTEYTGSFYVHVIDTRNPRVPLVASSILMGSAGHTSECLDEACNWVYGSEGQILDLRDKFHPVLLEQEWTDMLDLPDGHAINIDSAGLATIDTTPLTFADLRNPMQPKVLAQAPEGEQDAKATAYQHNTLRPTADLWKPRTAATRKRAALTYGEVIMGNGETNGTGTCNDGSGPFATWSARDWDRGAPLKVLDVFRPVSGDYSDGDPAINVLGCSGHWFSTRTVGFDGDQLVAAGWYEHGTRLLRVDAQTGTISQVGFHQPVLGSASAAHWVGDHHIYVVDYARGIDILRYDPTKPAPTQAQLDTSWLAKAGVVNPLAESERQLCQLYATNET